MTQEGGSAERSTKLAELEIQLSFHVFLKTNVKDKVKVMRLLNHKCLHTHLF